MEPFFWRTGRKILPDEYGQQDLSAAHHHPLKTPKPLKNTCFSTWHGFRY
jgi:hypothetical protein